MSCQPLFHLQLATTAQTVVPTSTTYGQYPYLCGTNTGYHCGFTGEIFKKLEFLGAQRPSLLVPRFARVSRFARMTRFARVSRFARCLL